VDELGHRREFSIVRLVTVRVNLGVELFKF